MIRLGMNKSRKVCKQSWPVACSLIKGRSLLCDAHSTRAFCPYTWDVWSVCSWENKWWDRGKSTARPPNSPDLEISLCDVPWRVSCMISVSLTLISWGQKSPVYTQIAPQRCWKIRGWIPHVCSMAARRVTLRDKFRGCSSVRAAGLQPPVNFRKLKKYPNKTLR